MNTSSRIIPRVVAVIAAVLTSVGLFRLVSGLAVPAATSLAQRVPAAIAAAPTDHLRR